MARRAEAKERRRRERLAAEEAARTAAARKKAWLIGGGVAAGLIVLAVVVVVATGGGGGGDGPSTAAVSADAKAAGCNFQQFESEGREHTAGKVNYKTNPPTSGPHNPVPAQDGIYAPGNTPAKEAFVHSLEHGRIEFQYKAGTSAADIAKLRRLAEEPVKGTGGYHVLMFENNTNMPEKFAAAAWTKSISCPALTPQAIAAMRAFRQAYTDKGPEFIP
jgi:hypothetical protein